MDGIESELKHLNDALEGLARINDENDPNLGYTFSIDVLDRNRSTGEATIHLLNSIVEVGVLELTELTEWRAALEGALGRWLFLFQQETYANRRRHRGKGEYYQACLKDIHGAYTLYGTESPADFISAFVVDLDNVVQIRRVFEVRVQTKDWYEAGWEDFAIEGEHGSVFLHLGVSD